jgi:hypothetical protein
MTGNAGEVLRQAAELVAARKINLTAGSTIASSTSRCTQTICRITPSASA